MNNRMSLSYPNRYRFLDAQRGIAILLVFSYHSFARWTDVIPYQDSYANIALFKYGHLGVQLFFILSGFVILMSLEKSSTVPSFLIRRWLRIFPAMLFCSILLYATAKLFPYRPNDLPHLSHLIPGLTLVDLNIWTWLFGYPDRQLEGVFWSIYVEVKFYIFASVIYFRYGRVVVVFSLFAAYIVAVVVRVGEVFYSNEVLAGVSEAIYLLSFRHFGWFAIGAACYLYWVENRRGWLLFAIFVSALNSMTPPGMVLGSAIGCGVVSMFFIASIANAQLQRMLNTPVLLYFGYVSYPFYLIHENASVSLIVSLSRAYSSAPDFLVVLLVLGLVSVAAFGIARFIEPFLKGWLTKLFKLT